MSPSAASSKASALATSTWRSIATIAVLMCQPHNDSVSRATSIVQPVASIVSRSARAMSLLFDARRSTIRLPKTLCSRTISALENVLSAIFCAVPAFRRVEPLMTSAPVASVMPISASAASGEPGLLAMPIVNAPHMRACWTAPST